MSTEQSVSFLCNIEREDYLKMGDPLCAGVRFTMKEEAYNTRGKLIPNMIAVYATDNPEERREVLHRICQATARSGRR